MFRNSMVLLLLFTLGCSGEVKDDGDGTDDDVSRPPPSGDSLNRNPERQLICEAPSALEPGPPVLARLTNEEYLNTLRDLVAPLELKELPELPRQNATGGFANNWEGQVVTDRLVEQVERGADAVARTVHAGLAQLSLSKCPPSGEAEEKACVESFLDAFGERAYRRPLHEAEREAALAFFDKSRTDHGFDLGFQMLVQGLVQAPQFVYRVEFGEPTNDPDVFKLSGHEVAARLSYLLWDTMPDADLFEAARKGKLDTAAGVAAQVERMLADPRGRATARDFSNQFMDLEHLATKLSPSKKNAQMFPNYNEATATALLEGLEAFAEDALMGENGGLRKLLTSQKAWVNEASAPVYGLTGLRGLDLVEVDLPDQQRRGLLTQAGLLAGLSHETVQASVLRGVFVMEKILCQKPPPVPEGLTFDPPTLDPSKPKTNRQILVEDHEAQGGACQSCHSFIDGIGFAFENYNAIGAWQDEEAGLPIDPTGELMGTSDVDGKYTDGALPMIDALATSGQVAQCFVEHWHRYAMTRSAVESDGCDIARLTDKVVEGDDSLGGLLRGLVSSPSFRYRRQGL